MSRRENGDYPRWHVNNVQGAGGTGEQTATIQECVTPGCPEFHYHVNIDWSE